MTGNTASSRERPSAILVKVRLVSRRVAGARRALDPVKLGLLRAVTVLQA